MEQSLRGFNDSKLDTVHNNGIVKRQFKQKGSCLLEDMLDPKSPRDQEYDNFSSSGHQDSANEMKVDTNALFNWNSNSSMPEQNQRSKKKLEINSPVSEKDMFTLSKSCNSNFKHQKYLTSQTEGMKTHSTGRNTEELKLFEQFEHDTKGCSKQL